MIRISHLVRTDRPDDAFAAEVEASFVPLVRALPGAIRTEAARVLEAGLGENGIAYLVDAWFPDEDALTAALASPAGRRLARAATDRSARRVEIVTCEVADAGANGAH
jgi:quinol monooxygenase YgiN